MTQLKRFTIGIMFAACAIAVLFENDVPIGDRLIIAGGFAVFAVPLLALWYYRYRSDKNTIATAHRIRQNTSQSPQLLPPMESGDNSRLFVPPPLN